MRRWILLGALLVTLIPPCRSSAAAAPADIPAVVTGSAEVFPISFWCGPPRDFVTVSRPSFSYPKR